MKLMKLWRLRQLLSYPTFAIEIVVGRALNGRRKNDHEACMNDVFNFLVGNLLGARLVDPANTNNIIDVSIADRQALAQKATAALQAQHWDQVVW
ncbi:MAG: hypothetical protein HY816_03705 [Candidatus Wallbacteria bacterium]|nr:hypothetical protein [Candidatus Wallbacteria bacterium]